MLLLLSTSLVILLSLLPTPSVSINYSRSPSKDAVLLSDVQSLTLHSHRKTSHRRVPAIPQLKCVGPPKVCALYNVDVMRCVNAGSDYDENDVQWTCTADIPPEFKLGSTDVVCEGYRNSEDPWVLKGSCGVEYRLLLSELGEKRYGRLSADDRSWPEYLFDMFMGVFTMVVVVFLLAVICCSRTRIDINRRNNRPWFGSGGGGGGGGGGWWGGPPGPPPPYDYQEPGYTKNESWRPGFWSGALGGGAAGYAMGRRSSGRRHGSSPGPSGWGSSSGPSRSSSSHTVESTGFGSTRRR